MPRYTIKSSGNGAFWSVVRLADDASLFLQGDDAVIFGEKLDSTHDRYTDDDVCAEYDEQFAPEVLALVDDSVPVFMD